MFQVQNATMIQGEALTRLFDMPSECIDAILTDPPYSTGGTYAGQRQQRTALKYQSSRTKTRYLDFPGDNRDQRSFLAWASLWLTQCYRVARPGGVLMVFIDWRQLPVLSDALQAGGWTWRHILVWDKPTARPMLGDFKNQCEFVLVGAKGKFSPWRRACLPGVFRCSIVAPTKRRHMTEKPVPLLEDLLQIVPEGGTVLDPFAGSGATGAACLRTGRTFIGMEMCPGYYEIACERLREEAVR
ncbi:MAG: hypothetical protein PWQ57_2033 [Desulfovibrionales bacterium]|nr:hypothetical protein [Desulfovibrionales bacterium]